MTCLFRGFNLVRNFFFPFAIRRAFGNQNEVSVTFFRSLFSCLRFLSAALSSLFVVPTLNAAPPGSTSPTYYYSAHSGGYNVAQTGPTPDIVAQAAVSYHNSQGGSQVENLQTCSVYAPLPGYASYLCYGDSCQYPGACTFGNQVEVWARCSPQSGADWDGTEFYCPPEPDCDGAAH